MCSMKCGLHYRMFCMAFVKIFYRRNFIVNQCRNLPLEQSKVFSTSLMNICPGGGDRVTVWDNLVRVSYGSGAGTL